MIFALAALNSILLLFRMHSAGSHGEVLNRNVSGQALNESDSGQAPPHSLPVVEMIRLAELKQMIRSDSGNVVLVNAWASWCKPCLDEMPGLLKARRLYRGKAFRFILISADDPGNVETKARSALKKFGVDFTSYAIADSTQDAFITGMSEAWNGALPATFLYDRRGRLAEMKVGQRTYRQLREAVARLLRN